MSLSRLPALLLATLFALAAAALPSHANPLDAIDDADEEALQALALYPEDVREQALVVSSEPALLVELQKLQDESRDDFRDLLGPYSQGDQEQLFELSRYPDLVEQIARGGQKSRGELERIAAGYPEDVRAAAVRQGSDRHRVVSRMYALLADFDGRSAELIEALPPAKREAFRRMLATPELLSLLSEHMDMTVLLGDAYERDPRDLRDALADLNREVAQRNAEEADEWQRSVESDPDLRRDYDAAARDYENDTGYSAYRAPSGPVVSIHINPFPFWVGYPWWYPVAYHYYDPWYWWYPRHAWGHCGYAYGPRVVVYGGPIWRPWYPTFHFTSWYFSVGLHHQRYPHLSDHFLSYYERPVVVRHRDHHYDERKRVVQKFVYETERVMPADYLRVGGREQRVERLREYGRIAPEIEKVEHKAWRKDVAGKRGARPGRDFEIRESGADPAARAETQKRVARSPKEFPELSKVEPQDWSRDRSRGEGVKVRESRERDAQPSFESRGGTGKEKGRSERTAPRFEAPSGETGKGAERSDGGTMSTRSDRVPERAGSRRGGIVDQPDARESGRSSKRQQESGNGPGATASPSFDAPARGRDRSVPKVERAPEPKRSRSYDAPAYQAPRTQAPRNQEPRYQTRRNEGPTYPTPRVQAPSVQTPNHQTPNHQTPTQREPRVERSGGGGERSGVRERSGGGGHKNGNDGAPDPTDASAGHGGRGGERSR